MQSNILNENIKTFLIESPKLKQNKLKNFVVNSLLINNYIYSQRDFIYLFYLENINSYEILVSKEKVLSFDILNSYIEENGFVSIKYEDFYILFFDKKPYYFQQIQNDISNDEVYKYLENKLKIKIDNKIAINKNEFEKLSKKFKTDNLLLTNINEEKRNQFKAYILYCLLILLSLSTYIFYNQSEKQIPKTKVVNKEYPNFISYYEKHKNLLSKIRKHKLKLKTLIYEKKLLNLTFESKNKSDIYSFLLEYKNKISNSSITYIEKIKLYECIVDVKKF